MSCAGVCSAARTAPSSSAFTRTLTLRQPNCYENGSDLITQASLVSVSGIFIFNWLRWSFRPRSALYFRWHLTALTDISFVFFFFLFTRLHETVLSETAIKTLMPLRVKASPFSLCVTFETALLRRNDSHLDEIYSEVRVQQVVEARAEGRAETRGNLRENKDGGFRFISSAAITCTREAEWQYTESIYKRQKHWSFLSRHALTGFKNTLGCVILQ